MNRILLAITGICLCLGLSGGASARPADASAPLMETLRGEKPIELQALNISAHLRGGLAETVVRMTFYNPNPRQLEGNLQFPLLDGQQVTGFALDFDGRLRAAVPVQKSRGRQVFEDIERVNVDPALLEKTQGNNFRLRVYPIPAEGTRIVELSYTESLPRQERWHRYRLPLSYGATVRRFSLDVDSDAPGRPRASGAFGVLPFNSSKGLLRAHLARKDFAPTGELELLLRTPTKPQVSVETRGDDTYFVAEVPVEWPTKPRKLPSHIGLLWDSSMSAASNDHASELALLDTYFRALGDGEVRLVRLRDRSEPAQTFHVVDGDWSALRRELEATQYDGASALADWRPEPAIGEYLLMSDGLLNYGPLGFPTLAPGQRLYAINSSASADRDRLRSLSEASGGRLVDLKPDHVEEGTKILLGEQPRIAALSGEGLADLEAAPGAGSDGFVRVAGRLLSPRSTLSIGFNDGSKTNIDIRSDASPSPLAARTWASFRLATLAAQPELRHTEIAQLGARFGIATSETSLIVLDRVEDYVEHDIAPPPELAKAYVALRTERDATRTSERDSHGEKVIAAFEERVAWWQKDFPKDMPPTPKQISFSHDDGSGADATLASMEMVGEPAPSPPVVLDDPQAAPPVALLAPATERSREPATSEESATSPESSISIEVKAWQADASYVARLRAAESGELYTVYLDERSRFAGSVGFYLDVADVLIERNQKPLALRVLSNIAEMDLDNRHVLRVLGYRLMQAGEPELAVPVFEKVLRIADYEPQSFRDLGNALAAAGRDQEAIDALSEVVLRPWDGRFADIELIALAELNAIVANSKSNLDAGRLDPRLRRNLPLDMRVVLTWDADNSDMDLWVTDPNGEKCFYSHKLTYQGGRMSNDFTGGYGPEEFALRVAKPGRYKVEVNYFGDRQQSIAGPTSLQLRFTTKFGTAATQDKRVSLRLKERSETVLVGEFDVE